MQLAVPILMPAIRLDRDGPAEEALALKRAAEPWLAGFIIFGGEAAQVRALTARLREAAGRDLLMASDMERGAGQQIQGLTQTPPPGLVGFAGTPSDAYRLGMLTAGEARSVGIDVIFAPCADVRSELENPILGNRSYGFDPVRVGRLAADFGSGVAAAGGLPVAKHFPGHGATTTDSHESIPVVRASVEVLEGRDLVPFEVFASSVPQAALMTAHVTYPALEPAGGIASFSQALVARAKALGRGGEDAHPPIVFTDALIMTGAICDGDEVEGARRSLRAGCDVLLYPGDPERVAAEILTDASLAARAADAAALLARTLAMPRRQAMLGEPAAAIFEELGGYEPLLEAPRIVARRAVELAGVPRPASQVLVIDDDDMERRGDVLLQRGGDRVTRIRVPRDEPLPDDFAAARAPYEAVPTVVVLASCRGWKGSSGVSDAGADLAAAAMERANAASGRCQMIWCTPRPRAPHGNSRVGVSALHLPGTGHHLEAALADELFAPGA